MTPTNRFKPEKKVLSNGLTVLVRPCHNIPRVEVHILYNVGSKDEDPGQKGIAHFIEHMLFKGTEKLSETDLNLISHKLTGSANAFTSQDYTGYTFRFPSNSWEVALELCAECMQQARFDQQMIDSEIKTVVEELRMYRDDYQNHLLETIINNIWPEHPYGKPVVGSHYDLCTLTRQHLIDFYRKHYHPRNATLVVAGDVTSEQVFKAAEKHFSQIPSPQNYEKIKHHFHEDLVSKSTTMYRHINTPWSCLIYVIPGSEDGVHVQSDITSLILGNGKSSRLYRRLVDKEQLAIDIESAVISFFEKGLFCISYYPTNAQNIPIIEKIIEEEIAILQNNPIEAWELQGATKKAQFDYSTLLESNEKQALLIGTAYLATHNENFLHDYFAGINKLTCKDLQTFIKQYLNPRVIHKGYLLPLVADDQEKLKNIQAHAEQVENDILHKHQRTAPIEPGKFVNTLTYHQQQTFDFPKPEQFRLANGLEVVYYNNTNVPNIAIMLKFKTTTLYDAPSREGCFLFLLRLLTDSSAKYTAEELNQLLESHGIILGPQGEYLSSLCLSQDLEKTLEMLAHLLTAPSFNEQNIEKIRAQILNELTEYWDTPIEYIDQLTKQHIYQQHPYSRPMEGSLESIKAITPKDLQVCYKNYISPESATLVIVGNLTTHDVKKIVGLHLGPWTGATVTPFTFPPYHEPTPQNIHIPSARDQVVLVCAAPSIARTDKNFHGLAILDIILTGGPQGSTNARLFELREKTGLFYAIGGSLVHGSRESIGMMFIKTVVSFDKVEDAKKLILDTLDNLGKNGITQEEFSMAKDLAISSSVELFENNMNIVQTFLFLKRFNLNFNLFDKQTEMLSILRVEDLNKLAKKYCSRHHFSVITIGRAQNAGL